MNSERNIVLRLFESKYEELDEKTYTVGDTQYWKRGGKTYKWTQSGGRQECSEDEYYKALSGGTSGNDKVKNTDPSNDKAKDKQSNTKLSSFKSSLNDEETESFDYMLDSSSKEMKNVLTKYASRSSKHRFAKLDRQDADQWSFDLPKDSWSSVNKDLYNSLGPGISYYGGTAYKYNVKSADGSGDFDLILSDVDGVTNLLVNKHY